MTRVERWRSGCGAVALGVAVSVAWLGGAVSSGDGVLKVDGRSNANPSIAAAGAFVAVAWVASAEGGGAGVFAAVSSNAGRTFSTPVPVSGTAAVDVSGEQPPRVVLGPRQGRAPGIVVVWTSKTPSGTRLLTARSDDGGRQFSAPALVPGSDAAGNRGWESVAMTPGGDAFAVWLDHRETASNRPAAAGGAHQHAHAEESAAETAPPDPSRPDGAIRAQLSKLFFGPVSGSGAARALAGGVCYCCKTTLAAGPDGRFYAAWRHVYPGNLRDIAFTMSDDGGKTFAPPVRVSEDRWVLNGCPENGPSLAVDARRRVHMVWPTLVPAATPSGESTLALFYAMSSDGRRFTARQRIPATAVARHPHMALGPAGDVFVVWDESTGGRRQIGTARGTVDVNGVASFTRRTIDDKEQATYPVVAVTADGPLVAHVSRPATGPSLIRVTRVSP
jgi:hypothetical protein